MGSRIGVQDTLVIEVATCTACTWFEPLPVQVGSRSVRTECPQCLASVEIVAGHLAASVRSQITGGARRSARHARGDLANGPSQSRFIAARIGAGFAAR